MYHASVRFVFRAETYGNLYHYSEEVLVIIHKFDCLKAILKDDALKVFEKICEYEYDLVLIQLFDTRIKKKLQAC